VDYLQLIQGPKNVDTREQEISHISRSLKALSKELEIPVVAMAQLSRQVEKNPNKRPRLADLRESGAIEQDADLIAFLYREETKEAEESQAVVTEVIIGKNRNGPTDIVKLVFLKKFTRFEDHTGKI
jgi:replicative DNA helicase